MTSHTRTTEIADLLARLAELMTDQSSAEPVAARPMPERVLLTVEEAAEQLGIGRTLVYKLIRTGEIDSVQIGRLRRIPSSAIHEYAQWLISNRPTNYAA